MEVLLITNETNSDYQINKMINNMNGEFKIIIDLMNINPRNRYVCNLIENISKNDKQWKELYFLNMDSYKFDIIYASLNYFFKTKGAVKLICDFKREFCLSNDLPYLLMNKTSFMLFNNENVKETLEKINDFLSDEDFTYHKNCRYREFIKLCNDLKISNENRLMLSLLKNKCIYPYELSYNENYIDNYFLVVEGVHFETSKVIDYIKNCMPNCKILSIINSIISIEEVKKLKKLNVLFIDLSSCTVYKNNKPYKNIKKILKYKSNFYNFSKFILYNNIEYYKNDVSEDVFNAHNLYSSLCDYIFYQRDNLFKKNVRLILK